MSKNRTHSIDAAIEQAYRESATGEDRYVDLAMSFVLPDLASGELAEMLTLGGRWDRRLSDFDEGTDTGVVVRCHPGQVRAVEWFKEWLVAHAERRVSPPPMPDFDGDAFVIDTDASHAYSALLAGGRRAGKTYVAVPFGVAYALMFPGAIVWIVSPNDQKHDEIRRYLAGSIAEEWLERETNFLYEFCNGSVIELKSGHDADLLKEGKANLVIINEGQLMDARIYTVARGAIVDQSGLVLVCANPPVGKKDRQWVSDFAAEAKAGRRAAVYIEFDPRQNPHIDRVALLSMAGELDERTYDIEVLGHFRGAIDAVAYNWDRLLNEIKVPEGYQDVTSRFLEQTGEGEGITTIVGLDVQRIPYIGGPWYRLFVPPGVEPNEDNVLAWIVGETVLDGGDEVDFCDCLREGELDPESTMIVADASGQWQHSRRRLTDMAPPEWSGRGSFDIIRTEGYRRLVPPDRRMRKNPAIQDRVRAFTSMIATKLGRRRLFADPVAAPRTCAAIREWKHKHGLPDRTQDAAHLGDGASYPIVRLFPRRLRSTSRSTNHGPVQDPVASRVDNVIAMPASRSSLRILPPRGRGARTRGM